MSESYRGRDHENMVKEQRKPTCHFIIVDLISISLLDQKAGHPRQGAVLYINHVSSYFIIIIASLLESRRRT